MSIDTQDASPTKGEIISLLDGRQVVVRPLERSDFQAEKEFIVGLSPMARRYRFQEQIDEPSDALVESLVDLDHRKSEALAAFAEVDGRERIVGVARYAAGNDMRDCEIAISVLEAWHGHGLGTRLLEQLIAIARGRGLKRMLALEFTENHWMTQLVQRLGFSSQPDPDDRTQMIHTLDL